MFKAQILRRSFSLFNRGPTAQILRSAARNGHETVHIQRVRLQKPLFSRSRLIGVTIITGGIWGFLRWLEEEIEEEEGEGHSTPKLRRPNTDTQDKGVETDSGEEDEDDEEDDDALIFLPTGLSRPRPRTYYRGSDPEWQEFVRIAPDRQRMDRVRGELIALVRDLAVRNPQYVLRLGKINPNAGGVWIEYKFPDGPPIEYERPGIELTEDLNWRWTSRPVHEIHHQRITNALFPTAVASALYTDSKARAGRTWQDFKVYMGWQKKQELTPVQKLLSQFPANPPPTPNSTAPTTAATSTSTPPPAPSTDNAQSSQQTPTSSPPLGNPAYERFGLALPDPKKTLLLDLSNFRQNFRKEHKPYKMQPPRGTFMVSGLIEIIGEKARMTLDVSAAYDPKIGQYVMLKAQLRSVTDYRQVPRGGP